MAHDAPAANDRGFHGPRCWAVSTVLGLALGILWAFLMPVPAGGAPAHVSHAAHAAPRVKEILPSGELVERFAGDVAVPWRDEPGTASPGSAGGKAAHSPDIPIVLCFPFAALLASIALMPFINARFWHHHYPDFAFLLGGLVCGYYLAAMGEYGRHAVVHSLIEYYSFIALVGGLFVVSGGILIHVHVRATPLANTLLLAVGAVVANIVGTTGASMLLIRPFMRMNRGRLRPVHVVMFIFIVSNCAGSLTPIGDPPLYLGFLKGVPFLWTLEHMWPMWLLCVALLLAIFFVIDARLALVDGRRPDTPLPSPAGGGLPPVLVRGTPAFVCLALMVLGVFIDPLLKKFAGVEGIPIGATFQVVVAGVAYRLADVEIHEENTFSFEPVKEVALLFVGIFLTMIPALGYLAANASKLGMESPAQFYFFTGSLSAVLDNAPTYLNFLQAALGVLHLPLDATGIARFIANEYEVIHAGGAVLHFRGQVLLEAISLGAVFFGAMTYIGNGPNFMVKSISEASGVRMPSFFGYVAYAVAILLPVLVVVWLVFIR